jgi:hypothetical protein
MNFGACVVNVSDDRPSELENGESTDCVGICSTTNKTAVGRRSLSALMKGTLHIGLVHYIVSYY